MPIPFIVGAGIAAAATTGAVGIGKGIHAAVQNSEAKDVNERASDIYDEAKSKLENAREVSETALESLGRQKLTILDKSINRFVNAFEKIHDIEIEDSAGLRELSKFRMDSQSLKEFRELGSLAASMVGGTVGGLAGGGLAALGAYGAAMTFGAASTGTAIASLSGIAATNATLAFLGGGSLAAGGLGIAGGTAVLGGVVAGPALAVMGFIMDAKASANLDRAYSNLAESRKIAEELKTATTLCKGIAKRSMMFTKLLKQLDVLFLPLINGLEEAINTCGTDYRTFSSDEKKIIAMSMSIAGAVKKVLDTPILTVDGALTDESEAIGKEISGFLEAAKA